MGTQPWQGNHFTKEGANYPATDVSWIDATAFCEALSKKQGKQYSLPIESQWQYACRTGTTTEFSCGEDEAQRTDFAWFDKNADAVGQKGAHEVAGKKNQSVGPLRYARKCFGGVRRLYTQIPCPAETTQKSQPLTQTA